MGNQGAVGAWGLAGLQDAIRQRLSDQQKQREHEQAMSIAERVQALREQEAQQRADEHKAAMEERKMQLAERTQAANETEALKAGNTYSIDQSIPEPAAKTIRGSLQMANAVENPPLAQPPIAGMMQPDIVPGQQPGMVWKGNAQQQETANKKMLIGRLMQNPNLSELQKIAFEAENAGLKVPATGFEAKPVLPSAQENHAANRQYDLAHPMPEKPVKTPDPQPQIFFDKEGKPHAIQFTGGAAKEIPIPDGMTGKTGPSAATTTQKTNASNVLAHVQDVEQEAEAIDKMGLMGPVGGRWADFMAGRVGAGELAAGNPQAAELLGQFRADVGLLKSGMAMVHGGARGGGSPAIAARMDALINADKMDLSLFKGATSSFRKWLTTYAGDKATTTPKGSGIKSITEIK